MHIEKSQQITNNCNNNKSSANLHISLQLAVGNDVTNEFFQRYALPQWGKGNLKTKGRGSRDLQGFARGERRSWVATGMRGDFPVKRDGVRFARGFDRIWTSRVRILSD